MRDAAGRPVGPAAVAAVLALLALLGAGTTALQLTGTPSAAVLVPAALALASGTGAAVLATGARRLPGRAGRPWRAMALAAGLLALGQVLAVARAGRDLSAGGVEEVPTVLAVPVAVAVAVLLLPPRAGRRVGSRVLLDGVVVTIAVGVLGGVVLDDLLDALSDGAAGPGHGLIAAGYPLVGAVLCGVGLVTVTAVPEARRRSATWLLASFVAMATVAVSGAVGRSAVGAAGPEWSVVTVLAWLAMLGTGLCAAAADRAATAPGGRRALPLRGAVLAHAAATAALLAVTGGVVAGRPVPAAEAAAAVVLLLLTSARTLSWALDAARLTRRLERTEGWFRALVHSGDAVTVVLDAAGRVTSVSGPVAAQLGRAEEDLVGHELVPLLHPDDRDLVERVAAALRDGAPDGLPATGRLAGADGGWRDVEVSGAARTGARRADDGLVLHLRDVTERRAGQRELERLAYTDSLTGLPNRARFMAALEGALDRAARGRRACVLLVDLDGFKSVNDVAGHDAGDRLLREVADALRAEARSEDLVARLGGDEFALLLDAGPDAAMALAERLVARLDVSRRYGGADGGADGGLAGPVFRVSASVGLAEVVAGADASATVREADLALRTVKAQGKNGVRASGEGLVEASARRSRLARDLPGAIERGGLRLVYQPVVGVHERRVLGAEALVRWDHPVLGPVPPEEFVGLAEDDGLIVPLQRWVLETATAEHARLVAGGRDLKLGVNISVRHLQARCLVEDVTRALERSGLPARLLMVEVTESVLMDDDQRLLAELAELSALGCVVSLDDFGKGYSSLAYLARLPVDVLKMDRGFVSGIDTDPRGAALVGSVVDLGRTLGMDVVAEGVETAAQREVLVSLGCGFLQGWLTGRPVPAAELPAVVDGFDPGLLGAREPLPVPWNG
ncbi:PAS domain S-box-containing protein/diguanylate cyclase (GGDEF) domain-containing protein [Geodermatophilus dictyosporus]|uniref:PAS domain S-box-containing protein/diguanylate cyclase (GGDEF) domain-containing protein n=1 Tax=Geodermatophilus dictyosporus TaxID=1523247 RepID=A0A1I5KT39_9ACTN|nr:GGDEF domain-containing phosphodiesterase [Geodermatophilus dictyosporus]SFO88093.1 PAS domain S-box-containing protein/diguanylate cyclase (GGDEF) domain-containing protein [Geodermatophilus dictyosporus]